MFYFFFKRENNAPLEAAGTMSVLNLLVYSADKTLQVYLIQLFIYVNDLQDN